jgi:hypothetical protein
MALLAAVAVASCGGRSVSTEESDGEPLGPVHEGKGQYSLTIETLSSDCEPPHASGDLGRVIVYVKTSAEHGTLTIPYFSVWPDLGPAYWDVDLHERRAWELEIMVSPPCSELIERFEYGTLRADSESMDIEWIWSIRGVETCPGELAIATRDCVSHQIFHFRWLRACADEVVSQSCP